MLPDQPPLRATINLLRAAYGPPKPPLSDPLHLILRENAAYLLSDERRQHVFGLLRERVGLERKRLTNPG
jgi:hypothetical protein